jgi:hypothetical protein
MLMEAPVRVIASLKQASAQTVGQPAQASAGGTRGEAVARLEPRVPPDHGSHE